MLLKPCKSKKGDCLDPVKTLYIEKERLSCSYKDIKTSKPKTEDCLDPVKTLEIERKRQPRPCKSTKEDRLDHVDTL